MKAYLFVFMGGGLSSMIRFVMDWVGLYILVRERLCRWLP